MVFEMEMVEFCNADVVVLTRSCDGLLPSCWSSYLRDDMNAYNQAVSLTYTSRRFLSVIFMVTARMDTGSRGLFANHQCFLNQKAREK